MPPKIIDLKLYEGISPAPYSYYLKDSISNLSDGKLLYAVPEIDTTNQLSVSNVNYVLSNKIYDRINDDNTETVLMSSNYTVTDNITIDIDTNIIKSKPFGNIDFSDSFSITFTSSPIVTGTPFGLTSFGLTQNVFTTGPEWFFVGFINAIVTFKGNLPSSNVQFNNFPVSFDIIDIVSTVGATISESVFLISKDFFFIFDPLPTVALTQRKTPLTDLTNLGFHRSAANLLTIFISGSNNNINKVYVTQETLQSGILFTPQDTVISIRMGLIGASAGNTFRTVLTTPSGYFPFNTSDSDPNGSFLAFVSVPNVSRDGAQLFALDVAGGSVDIDVVIIANSTGLYDTGGVLIATLPTISFTKIAASDRFDNNVGITDFLMCAYSDATKSLYLIKITTNSGVTYSLIQTIDIASFIGNSDITDLKYERELSDGEFSDAFLFTSEGRGVGFITSTDPFFLWTFDDVYSRNYTLTLTDFIKNTDQRYYYLLREKGSGESDINPLLLRYDERIDEFNAGTPANFLPVDRLWNADNFFLLRDSNVNTTFYFLDDDDIDLVDITEASITSNNGFFITTYAGNIAEILVKNDLFYIVGTEGIEVWENTGAANFPYRKQSYLSIPYHAPAYVDNFADYDFPPLITARYKNDYVVIGYSSINNQLNIIYLSDGKYKLLSFDFNKVYNFINNPQFSSSPPILGFSIGSGNFWGKDYIILNAINATNLNTSFSFAINDQGNFTRFPNSTDGNVNSFFSNYYRVNGFHALRFDYNDVTDLITYSQLKVPFSSPDSSATDEDRFFTATTDLINLSTSELVYIKKLIIRFSYPVPIETPSFTDVIKIQFSTDKGQTFQDFPETVAIDSTVETILFTNLGAYNDVLFRIVTNKSIIINSALAIIDDTGVK